MARNLGISREEFEFNLNQDKTIIKKLYHNYCEYFNQSKEANPKDKERKDSHSRSSSKKNK